MLSFGLACCLGVRCSFPGLSPLSGFILCRWASGSSPVFGLSASCFSLRACCFPALSGSGCCRFVPASFLALLLSAFRLSLSACSSLSLFTVSHPSLLHLHLFRLFNRTLCNRPPFPPSFGSRRLACQVRNRSRAGSRVHSCPPLRSVHPDHSPRFAVAASRHEKASPSVKKERL